MNDEATTTISFNLDDIKNDVPDDIKALEKSEPEIEQEFKLPDEPKAEISEPVKEEPVVSILEPVDDTEQRAREQGHVPKDQWKGNPDDWEPPHKFLKTKELFNFISSQNKQVKELKETVNHLVDHNKKIEELTYKKAIEDIKRKQLSAAEIGDTKTVAELTDKLIDLQTSTPQAPTVVTPPPIPEAVANSATPAIDPEVVKHVQAFSERNKSWYNNDLSNLELSDFARRAENHLAVTRPDLDLPSRLRMVEQEVYKKFPSRFTKRDTTNISVEGGGDKPPSTGKKLGFNDLNAYHKGIVRRMQQNHKGFSSADLDDYINQLKIVGEI